MFRRILKWALWVTGLLAALLLLLAAVLFFMPRMVSTDWFRQQFEARASKSLHRPITVRDLQWTWNEGIRVKGIEAADDPEYGESPILSVDQLLFSFDFELDPKRLLVHLEVDGLRAHLIREKNGRTNLEAWLAQLKPPREPTQPTQPTRSTPGERETPTPLMLPGDLAAHIRLKNASVMVKDRMEDRLLRVHDGTLDLDMPSLLSKPVRLSATSRQVMNGKELPPLDLSIHVDHLVDESRGIDPETARVNVNGGLPGLLVALQGSMAQKGLGGTLEMDLGPLAGAVQPFMPALIPRLSGQVLLQTNIQLAAGKNLSFDLNLACKNIRAAGGPLKEKQVGPFSITISQKGSVVPGQKVVNLDSGAIRLGEKSGLSYKGRLRMTEKGKADVNLTVAGVNLHLDEIQALAGGFIPGGIQWKGLDNAEKADFKIGQVELSGNLPDGAAHLSVKDMVLTLQELDLALSENRLHARNVALLAPITEVWLKKRFPHALEIRLNLYAGNIRMSGKAPMELDECRISPLNVTAKDLSLSPEALWGVAGRINIEESGTLKNIRLPPHEDGADRLAHGFKAHLELPPASEARIIFVETDLSTAGLKMAAILPRPLKEGLVLKGRVKDALITRMEPLRLDVGHLEADLRSGDSVELHLQGTAFDSGMKGFHTEGRISMDLSQVLKLVPPGLAPGGRFAGRVETGWQLKGRRPGPREIARLTDDTLSLEKRLQYAGFLEKLELEAEVSDLDMTLPLDSGEALSVQGVNATGPLGVSIHDGLKSFVFQGKLQVDEVMVLPGVGKLKTPLSVGLSFDGVCRNLNSLVFRETLQLAPLSVEQTLELSLNKLRRLLRQESKPDLGTILKNLEAEIKAGVSVDAGSGLAPFSRELALEGPLKGDLAVQLRGGKQVSARTRIESGGLDVTLPSKFKVTNLKTHLQLAKTYGLAFDSGGTGTEKPVKALSLRVLQPVKSKRSRSFVDNPLSQRLVEDLRGRLSGKPTLSFASARLEGNPFPILMSNAQVQMRFNRSLPSIDYFQMAVMGGTLLGDLRILERHGRYHLHMSGAFTGLDAERLLQRGDAGNPPNEKGSGDDTRISGRMSLRVPVSADARSVMDNLDGVFRLTHIGARTLERFLYAMDPHENNESIVRQRALLKKGTPRWIEVVVRNGNLSLTGAVTAAGSNIPLPAIKRLNVASLPIQKQIQSLATRLAPLLKGLKILSADTLWVEQGGAINFREDTK